MVFLYMDPKSSPGGQALADAHFGQGTGQIVLDNVQCTGGENQLLSCRSATILHVSSSCDHSDDAGVRCEGIYKFCVDPHENYSQSA